MEFWIHENIAQLDTIKVTQNWVRNQFYETSDLAEPVVVQDVEDLRRSHGAFPPEQNTNTQQKAKQPNVSAFSECGTLKALRLSVLSQFERIKAADRVARM